MHGVSLGFVILIDGGAEGTVADKGIVQVRKCLSRAIRKPVWKLFEVQALQEVSQRRKK